MTAPSLTEARSQDFVVTTASPPAPEAGCAATPSAAVAAEIKRYGSLEAAISGLVNDSDGAPWTAPIHTILNEALAYRSALGTNARAA